MSTVRQTLELAEDLKAHLSYPATHIYMGNVWESIRAAIEHPEHTVEDNAPLWEKTVPPAKRQHTGERIAQQMRTALEMGEFFYLTEEMRPVVEFASQQLEGTEAFTPDLFPSPFGFVVFEQGRVSADRRGKKIVTKAMMWARMSFGDMAGHVIFAFGDRDDQRDETLNATLERGAEVEHFMDVVGRLHLLHAAALTDDMRVGPQGLISDLLDEYGVPYVSDNEARFFMSFLLMLRQTIAAKRVDYAPPKMAKHLAKRRLPHQVTVVLLRRIEGVYRNEGESAIEWACRWLVRGHWRNARVSASYPGAVLEDGVWRARIWVHPFVKGPDGMPFRETTVVNALSR